MTGAGQRVAIIAGGSQSLGAGLVAAYRRRDWAIVTNSRTIKASEDGAVLTISGTMTDDGMTQVAHHESSADGVSWTASMDVRLRKVA